MVTRRQNSRAVVVFVTAPSGRQAARLARDLVRRRVAACVNVIPQVESVFWWKGAIDRCRESLLVIKTSASCVPRLKAVVLQLHPYEVPEFLALPILSGHQPYLKWIQTSVLP